MEAEYRTKCAECGEWIEPGEEIEKDEDGNWIHKDHLDFPVGFGYNEIGDY
jgi:hypothetical protein